MSSFAQKAIDFCRELDLSIPLPLGIRVLNPYADNPEILPISEQFYRKYYNDHKKRKLIIGINPGRLGAGVTGIPFTDTKRLRKFCHITPPSFETHAPSSAFVYEVIEAYGDVEKFFNHFYIHSVCPLGFIRKNKKGNWVNCNYYDEKILFEAVKPFIISNLKAQINLGIDTSEVYVLGKKNAKYLKKINASEKLFGEIVSFAHPRYVMQYKNKEKELFITDYLEKLTRF